MSGLFTKITDNIGWHAIVRTKYTLFFIARNSYQSKSLHESLAFLISSSICSILLSNSWMHFVASWRTCLIFPLVSWILMLNLLTMDGGIGMIFLAINLNVFEVCNESSWSMLGNNLSSFEVPKSCSWSGITTQVPFFWIPWMTAKYFYCIHSFPPISWEWCIMLILPGPKFIFNRNTSSFVWSFALYSLW